MFLGELMTYFQSKENMKSKVSDAGATSNMNNAPLLLEVFLLSIRQKLLL